MQDGRKTVWRIPYVSVAFFPSLKQNFIAYHSSKMSSRPDCLFENHQLCQSGFSRAYSSCSCSCSFETEIIKIGQSSHNSIVNFQESPTILNACTKKSGNLLNSPRTSDIEIEKGRHRPLPVLLDNKFDIKLRVDDMDSIEGNINKLNKKKLSLLWNKQNKVDILGLIGVDIFQFMHSTKLV